jgi:hypothetical protein
MPENKGSAAEVADKGITLVKAKAARGPARSAPRSFRRVLSRPIKGPGFPTPIGARHARRRGAPAVVLGQMLGAPPGYDVTVYESLAGQCSTTMSG